MGFKTLQIKNPCNQNWAEMPVQGIGRHCGKCDHIIHDFSEMTPTELIDVLQSGKYKCGQFDADQMGTMYYINEKQKERKKYWAAIAAALVAGFFQVSNTYSQQDTHVRKPMTVRKEHLLKYPTDPSNGKEQITGKRDEKFMLKILDASDKQGLGYMHVQVGDQYFSSTLEGNVELTLPFDPNESKSVKLTITGWGYHNKTVVLNLNQFYGKVKSIFLRKKKKQDRTMVLGLWG